MFVESIDMHESVLKGPHRTDREIAEVKVVPGLAERAELSATGAAVGGPEDQTS